MRTFDAKNDPTRPSIIRSVIEGDDEAWDRFSRGYEPLLKSYVGHRVKKLDLAWSAADIDDVVQDIFVKLVQAMPRFAYDPSKRFRSYLSTCTTNAIYDRLGQSRPVALNDDDRPVNPETEDPDVVLRYFIATLGSILSEVRARCLAAGNETTWRCFLEAALKGRQAADIATEIGLSTAAVWANSARVAQRVHKAAQEQYELDFGDDGFLELLWKQGPGVLTGLCAEVLGDAPWLDPEAAKPLDYFRDLLREQLPELRSKLLARSPSSWEGFEQYLRDREVSDAPPSASSASILDEVDRLCRTHCEKDLGDAKLYRRLRREADGIIADLCSGALKEMARQ